MYSAIILGTTIVGAIAGAISAGAAGSATILVMGLVGALFGCPVGVIFCLILRGFRALGRGTRGADEHRPKSDRLERQVMEIDPFMHLKMGKGWIDEQERVRVADEMDSTTKSITKW